MIKHSGQQRGAILILMAILIVVLIGIAALALDLGRLFVQRTELQNAADAAALAAAYELDGAADAQTRAKAAARQLLSPAQDDRGIYFGDFTPDDDLKDADFKFYSSIDPVKLPSVDGGASAEESRFVEVTIDLTQVGEGIQLFFLPVLQVLATVDDVLTEAGTRAIALAGVETVPCYQPAMFMCVDDKNNLPVDEGDMLWMRVHGGKNSAWTSGNFGFLLPAESKTGAPNLQHYLANVGREACVSDAQYVAKTGQVAQKSKQGINSRFDIYESGVTPLEYPPAPNIINYSRDVGLGVPGDDSFRVGNGNWGRIAYFNTYHSTVSNSDRPDDWNTSITRWETYLWELGLDDDGKPDEDPNMPEDLANLPPLATPPTGPCDPADPTYDLNVCHGVPDPNHFYCLTVNGVVNSDCSELYDDIYPSTLYTGSSPETKTEPPVTDPFRRVMYVAALECETLGLNGAWDENDVDVLAEGRILEFLLTEYATHPGGNTDKFELFGEFIGDTEEGSGLTRRIIQLYE